MKIDVLTLFPKMFQGPFEESIVKRAQEKKLVEIKIHNLRDWAKNKHKTVDDRPYGGGTGMVIKPQPVFDAVESLKCKMHISQKSRKTGNAKCKIKEKIILLTPQGKVFNQKMARRLSKLERLILICGHYEGVDERVREHLVDEEISIGDYVLTGGELPAIVLVDAITRLIPGVLKKEEAVRFESFSNYNLGARRYPLLEYPQYTRPGKFKNWKVPEILLSGNHREIEKWRQEQALARTRQRRPDLLKL